MSDPAFGSITNGTSVANAIADGTAKILDNVCYSTIVGINLNGATGNNPLVVNNTIRNCLYVGFYCDTNNNIIHHNKFISNGMGTDGWAQAADDKVNNLWYDEETKEGNYWSDLDYNSGVALERYNIEGDADNYDPYPLNADGELVYPPEEDDAPAFNIFIVSLSMLTLGLIVRKRR